MNIEVEVEADDWLRALPGCEGLVRTAALAALSNPLPLEGRGQGEGGLAASASVVRPPHPTPSPQGGEGSVTILLTDDAEVRVLNRDHRRQDKPTNVLSFPAHATAVAHLGDLALAYETCAREAAEHRKPLADHLRHLVVHGVLHLLGEDHADDATAEAMEGRERAILATLGVPDPYLIPA